MRTGSKRCREEDRGASDEQRQRRDQWIWRTAKIRRLSWYVNLLILSYYRKIHYLIFQSSCKWMDTNIKASKSKRLDSKPRVICKIKERSKLISIKLVNPLIDYFPSDRNSVLSLLYISKNKYKFYTEFWGG